MADPTFATQGGPTNSSTALPLSPYAVGAPVVPAAVAQQQLDQHNTPLAPQATTTTPPLSTATTGATAAGSDSRRTTTRPVNGRESEDTHPSAAHPPTSDGACNTSGDAATSAEDGKRYIMSTTPHPQSALRLPTHHSAAHPLSQVSGNHALTGCKDITNGAAGGPTAVVTSPLRADAEEFTPPPFNESKLNPDAAEFVPGGAGAVFAKQSNDVGRVTVAHGASDGTAKQQATQMQPTPTQNRAVLYEGSVPHSAYVSQGPNTTPLSANGKPVHPKGPMGGGHPLSRGDLQGKVAGRPLSGSVQHFVNPQQLQYVAQGGVLGPLMPAGVLGIPPHQQHHIPPPAGHGTVGGYPHQAPAAAGLHANGAAHAQAPPLNGPQQLL
eukprot:Lankesteria_metandrocarpae@DN9382_c0_g1_i1.p1